MKNSILLCVLFCAFSTSYYSQEYCTISSDTCLSINQVSLGTINNTSTCSATGYRDYTELTTSLTKEEGSILIVQSDEISDETNCFAWVDWNQDGDFDDIDEEIELTLSWGQYVTYITPSITTLNGKTRMRVQLSNGVPNSCGMINSGETEDYSVIIYCESRHTTELCYEYISIVSLNGVENNTGCTSYSDYSYLEPVATVEVGVDATVDVVVEEWEVGDHIDIWIDWNQDGDFDDVDEFIGEGVTENYIQIFAPPSGIPLGQTKMRVRLSYLGDLSPCGNQEYGETEDYTIQVGNIPPDVYCLAGSNDCSTFEYISFAYLSSFGSSISNFTNCNTAQDGYSNFTDQIVHVKKGELFSFFFEVENYDPLDQLVVWIDWNQDGDFDDEDETYESSFGIGEVVSALVDGIPPDFAQYGPTRLRARLTWDSEPTPCGITSFGEVEDYTVYVDNPGTIQIEMNTTGVWEDGFNHYISVSRRGGDDGISTVRVTTESITAFNGIDFSEVDEELTWLNGETGVKIVSFTANEDAEFEGIEEFNVHLSDITNSSYGEETDRTLRILDISYLSLKVFLEGPYESTEQLMTDNIKEHIPSSEPFTDMGYEFVSHVSLDPELLELEGDNAIVDWVLVVVARTTPPYNERRSAALLQRNGNIVNTHGEHSIRKLFSFENEFYNVIIIHRNHFAVKSSTPFLSFTHEVSYDFTDPSTPTYGTNAQKNINGKMVMIAGDANRDGQINAVDKNGYWRLQNGNPYDYINSNADFNLDGSVNAVDKNEYWRVNNSMIEQLD